MTDDYLDLSLILGVGNNSISLFIVCVGTLGVVALCLLNIEYDSKVVFSLIISSLCCNSSVSVYTLSVFYLGVFIDLKSKGLLVFLTEFSGIVIRGV